MITHVIVELEHPIEEDWMRDYSDEYYGIGTPLIMCKDCKHWDGVDTCDVIDAPVWDNDFCSMAERKEE